MGTVSAIKIKNKGKEKAGMLCCSSKDLGDIVTNMMCRPCFTSLFEPIADC